MRKFLSSKDTARFVLLFTSIAEKDAAKARLTRGLQTQLELYWRSIRPAFSNDRRRELKQAPQLRGHNPTTAQQEAKLSNAYKGLYQSSRR
jgi:hypothetical protein